MPTLYVREKDGFQEASAQEVLLEAQELIEGQFRSRICVLDNIESIRLFLKVRLGARDHEVFAVLFLDTHRRLLEYVELFRGTIDTAAVHPREVVKEALKRNAAAVIFAHRLGPNPVEFLEHYTGDRTLRLLLPGQPMTAHWGVEDPASVEGSEADKLLAFREALRLLDTRIKLFFSLPLASLDRIRLQRQVNEIGKIMQPPGESSFEG